MARFGATLLRSIPFAGHFFHIYFINPNELGIESIKIIMKQKQKEIEESQHRKQRTKNGINDDYGFNESMVSNNCFSYQLRKR